MATAVLSIDIEARIANLEAGFQRASKLAKDFGAGMAAGSTTATAAGEKLLASMKEQIATFGLAGTQLQMYRAGQEGVAQQATLLTRVLDNLGNAEKRKAELQRVAIADDRERSTVSQQLANAQQQMVASLQREIDVFGKTAAEVRLMDAALIGAAAAVAPLAAQLERLQTEAKGAGATRTFIAALQSEVSALESEAAAAGKSASELKVLEAAHLGAAQAAGPLIARIEELRNAEAVAAVEAAKLAAARKEADSAVAGRQLFIEELKREREEIGKNRFDLLELKAARLDAAAAGGGAQPIGGGETGALIADIKRLQAAEQEAARARAQLTQQEKLGADQLIDAANKRSRFIEVLNREATAIGKTRSELLTLEAAEHGVSVQAQPMIDKLRQMEQHGGGQFGGIANNAKRTAFELQQVSYQLNDFFVQIASGQSPLTAFIQQGSQLSGTYGGVGAAFKGLFSLITPAIALFGTAAAVVGGLGFAFYKAVQEAEAFNKAISLTGNYAGVTADKINALAAFSAAASQAHVGVARDVLQGLVASGRFTGETLGSVSEAALNLQKNTGAATDEVVADFARMTDGVTKWAEEHNKQYHFLTASELEHIRLLEEEGRKSEAYIAVANAMNEHLKDQNDNVGLLIGSWRGFSTAASAAWDVMKGIGRDETLGEKIDELRNRLNAPFLAIGTEFGGTTDILGDRAAGERKLETYLRAQAAFEHLVTLKAKKKQNEEDLHQDNEFLRKAEEQFRTNGEKRAKEIGEINRKADDAIAKGGEFSTERRAKLIKNVEDKYKDQKGPAGAKDDPTKALLANRLKDYEHSIAEESEMHAAYNKLVDFYYSQNLISTEDYYAGRNQRDADGLKLKIDAYDKEIEAVRAHQAKTGKAVERAEDEGKINDLMEKKRKLTLEAQLETIVGSAKEVAAVKSLTNQINEMNGALQRLTGNKGEGAGAAFDKQYGDLKKKLEIEKNTTELANYDQLRAETVAQGALNDKVGEAALIYEKLRNTEENIAIARQFGTISELESLGALGAARAASIVQLESILKETEAIAATSSGTKLPLEAQKARLEFDKLRASGDVLGDHMRTLFKDDLSGPMTTFFDDLAAGKNVLDSLKGAFASFATSVVHNINSIVAKNFAESLFAKGSPGGDAASWLAKLFGGAGAGGATGGTSFAGGADAAAAESFISKIAAKDTGSSGVVDSLLGGLTGAKKGDAPGNPLYVSDVSLYGMTGGSGGGVAGGGGSGGGGLIGTGIKAIGDYFGSSGGASAGTSFAGGADSAAAETFFSMFAEAGAGAASGGETTPGWFMAGEKGRELIRTKGARVYNNRDTEKMLGEPAQKAGDTIHNYNITVAPPEGSDRRTALQWGEAVGQRIRSAGRNA